MRVLVAFDKFKEALAARAACETVADALHAAHPDWTLDICPLADGGDGFVASLTEGLPAEIRRERVTGPISEPVDAGWALVPARAIPRAAIERLNGSGRSPRLASGASIALIEMAACSGLALVPASRRNPLDGTSRGVGELLARAARSGADAILLGVGGSATNDLGLGALAALGWRALDAANRDILPLIPSRFREIVRFVPPPAGEGAPPHPPPIWIACDVDNPLCGPRGATFTYGPQKGLAPADLAPLDAQMERLGHLLAEAAGASRDLLSRPGTGAAGGISAGLMAACGARLTDGFELVSEWLELERRVAAADLVITGEGRFDDTSLQGKGPGGLARLALARGKRVVVLAGKIQLSCPPTGLEPLAITPEGMPLAEALPSTTRLLAEATRRCFAK